MSQTKRELVFFVLGFILFFVLGKFFFRRRDIYCTWCGSRKLKYLEGKPGEWFWEYRNNDGSRDNRVSGNFQRATFVSKWQCKKCGAVSRYWHRVDKNPSKAKGVYAGRLVTDGTGERSKTDYDTGGGTESILEARIEKAIIDAELTQR